MLGHALQCLLGGGLGIALTPRKTIATNAFLQTQYPNIYAVGDVAGPLAFSPLPADSGTRIDLRFNGLRQTVQSWQLGETVHLFCDLGATVITELDALAHAGEVAAEGGRLTAPMPGKVVSFAVKAGDAVKKGQPLAVMEAMKMEHTIAAPADGTVAELLFAPGDQVAEGAELLKIATASA